MFRWELDEGPEQDLASLPPRVRQALAEFMDAVVIVDPMEYQRLADEPQAPVRRLCFGPRDEGLVTFLVYPPEELVLVVSIQWLDG
ncbi:MAG: hypothetical protein ABJB47_11790 [Actinomycetota bacterium]